MYIFYLHYNTKSISGEGKTFVIINLAGLVAANGKRTIVLDLDLRKPKIHYQDFSSDR